MKTRICLYCGKQTTNGIFCNNACRIAERTREDEQTELESQKNDREKWENVDHIWDNLY